MAAIPELGGISAAKSDNKYVLATTIIFIILALLAIEGLTTRFIES
ncbi:hypothetical protein LCGC14_2218950 [marine sediment metagenome]|uniref:Uncharacterized protein n=1 Tax=marine sediment metagenome TaxID=412755 RepID=A0A0F9DBJ3_9ZZZZ